MERHQNYDSSYYLTFNIYAIFHGVNESFETATFVALSVNGGTTLNIVHTINVMLQVCTQWRRNRISRYKMYIKLNRYLMLLIRRQFQWRCCGQENFSFALLHLIHFLRVHCCHGRCCRQPMPYLMTKKLFAFYIILHISDQKYLWHSLMYFALIRSFIELNERQHKRHSFINANNNGAFDARCVSMAKCFSRFINCQVAACQTIASIFPPRNCPLCIVMLFEYLECFYIRISTLYNLTI